MSEDENRRTYGKCNNPYGHGHNYTVEITVSGQVDPRTGMVCDLVDLDGFVGREVVERYDLRRRQIRKQSFLGLSDRLAFGLRHLEVRAEHSPHMRFVRFFVRHHVRSLPRDLDKQRRHLNEPSGSTRGHCRPPEVR